jgi:hypothetical protein
MWVSFIAVPQSEAGSAGAVAWVDPTKEAALARLRVEGPRSSIPLHVVEYVSREGVCSVTNPEGTQSIIALVESSN